MYRVYKQNENFSMYLTELVADTEADIPNLPTNLDPGSTCIVAASSNVYILNASKEWVKLG